MSKEKPGSIRFGDDPVPQILVSITPSHEFLFHGPKGEVGRLSWKKGKVKFTGNASQSTKIFFKALIPFLNQYFRVNKFKG